MLLHRCGGSVQQCRSVVVPARPERHNKEEFVLLQPSPKVPLSPRPLHSRSVCAFCWRVRRIKGRLKLNPQADHHQSRKYNGRIEENNTLIQFHPSTLSTVCAQRNHKMCGELPQIESYDQTKHFHTFLLKILFVLLLKECFSCRKSVCCHGEAYFLVTVESLSHSRLHPSLGVPSSGLIRSDTRW